MRIRAANGWTLIELLVFILLLAAIALGIKLGLIAAESHGVWIKIVCASVGAIAGGVTLFLAFFLLASPFLLFGAIKRSLEPADLVCRCAEGTSPHLKPETPIQVRAIEESRRLADLRPAQAHSADVQRIALAAQLGHPAAADPRQALIKYKHWVKLPADLQVVLRSGLPPRLCVLWAAACAERMLLIFEREFHQDTRPRQAFGAAVLLLQEATPEALEFCRNWIWWRASEAGCRVVHRDLEDRFLGRKTSGEKAAAVLFRLPRNVADFADPIGLWAVYPSGDQGNVHMTPEHRCAWAQPCFDAEQIAFDAANVTGAPYTEYQWQRQELAHLILGWERWHEDREAWRKRVEDEWIPKVLAETKGLPFNVPAYVERMRRELVPWERTP